MSLINIPSKLSKSGVDYVDSKPGSPNVSSVKVKMELDSGLKINTLSGLLNATNGEIGTAPANSPTKNDVLKWDGAVWRAAPYNASFTFSISSFTTNIGANIIEIGTGVWKAIGAISFSAAYNNGPATGGYVAHSGWSNLTLTNTFQGPTTNTQAENYPGLAGSSHAFTLYATDGSTPVNTGLTYYFYTKEFWGVSSSSSLDEAGVEGLASNGMTNTRARTFAVTANTGEFIYYCYPTRLGAATFTVGGFEGGFDLLTSTLSITNAGSYTEDYRVYRSTNSGLGTTTVVVS